MPLLAAVRQGQDGRYQALYCTVENPRIGNRVLLVFEDGKVLGGERSFGFMIECGRRDGWPWQLPAANTLNRV